MKETKQQFAQIVNVTPAASRMTAAFVMALTLCAVGFSAWQFWRFSQGSLLSDFRGFYCAGSLAGAGVDPYRQEPLYSCEASAAGSALWHAVGRVTDPAPLPPYAIAFFVPVSRLPLGAAALAWSALLAGAWIGVVLALRTMTGYSWGTLFACVCFAAMMSISLGQIAPLAIAALSIAAVLIAVGKPHWAGGIAAFAMIEPHVALPACVAIFIAIARARLPMLAVGAALLAISLLFGIERNIEYVTSVLPAHALSDVWDVGQFSATVLAHVAGLPDAAAERLGSLWYALAAIAGIATAYVLAKRLRAPHLVALVPMAFAVFGGPYVHWQQVVAAIPAALVLLHLRRESSPWLVAAIVGLAIPWMYVVGWGFFIPGAAAIAGTICWQLGKPRLLTEVAVVVGVFCVLLLLNHGLAHTPAAPSFTASVAPGDWADVSWGAYVRARIPIGTGIFFWLHLPTWAALGIVVVAALLAAARAPSHAISARAL